MWSASPEGYDCTEEGEGGSCEQSQHSAGKEEGPILGEQHSLDYTGVRNCALLLFNLPQALLCIAVNGDTICELRNLENKTSPSPSSHTCNESLRPASSTHYIAQESAHFYPVHLTSGYQLCLGCYNSILTGLVDRSQDSLIVPNQATLPLVFKALRRGLGPRTAGGGRKSRDSGLRSGAKSVTVGSGHTGARGSPGGLLGGEAETTPSHFPDVISWEESELAALEPREIPRPQLRSIVRRGGWSLTACQDQAAVNHSPRTAESLGRPLKCPRSLPHVGSLV